MKFQKVSILSFFEFKYCHFCHFLKKNDYKKKVEIGLSKRQIDSTACLITHFHSYLTNKSSTKAPKELPKMHRSSPIKASKFHCAAEAI